MAQAMNVKITGHPAIDGEYLLEPKGENFFTNREFHLIKQETGIRPNEFDDAAAAGDSDVFVAFALVALLRAGKPINAAKQLVWDLTLEQIDVEPVTDDEPYVEEPEQLPPGNSPVEPS